MIARDISRKSFFREVSKELGFTALKTGIATLNCPYGNDYINKNFTLDMLVPNPLKLDLYKKFMEKMILSSNGDKFVYRNLGITYVSPEPESINTITKIAKNYNFDINIIDPNDSASIGLNPFVYSDPIKTGVAISSVLKALFTNSRPDIKLAYRENAAIQILENLSILLKEMYPRLNEDQLPNLEDLLDYLNDFSLTENMTEEMKQIPELAEKYKILIRYFENNFYKNAPNIEENKKSIFVASAELDNLLRYPGVKNILCNRNNNLDYDKALRNGEITLVCTRRGDLGESAHKAFGLFFILLMQQSILSRPGNDSNRIPNFLYIDDFPTYICKATEPIYTLYRKYKVATVLDSQNLSQLKGDAELSKGEYFRDLILSNCVNKVIFGNALPEDVQWWQTELEQKREWSWGSSYETNSDKDSYGYDTKLSGVKLEWKPNYAAGKIKSLKAKQIIYKVKNSSGKSEVDKGKLDGIDAKFKEPQKLKTFDFTKFSDGIYSSTAANLKKKNRGKFAAATADNNNYDIDREIDPIKTDTSDSKYLFDSEDAIIVNFKKSENNDNK